MLLKVGTTKDLRFDSSDIQKKEKEKEGRKERRKEGERKWKGEADLLFSPPLLPEMIIS